MSTFSWNDIHRLLKGKERKLLKRPSFWDSLKQTDQDYIMWRSESLNRAYIVESIDGKLSIWVLNFDPRNISKSRRAIMCSLCNFVHGGGSSGTRFFSLTNRRKTRSISFLACADLKCLDRCSELGVNVMHETLTKEEKIDRLHSSVNDQLQRFRAFIAQD